MRQLVFSVIEKLAQLVLILGPLIGFMSGLATFKMLGGLMGFFVLLVQTAIGLVIGCIGAFTIFV